VRTVLIIGIGAGDPDYVTVQAIKALNRVDAFFVIDKGAAKDDLVALRKEICARHIDPGRSYRFVEARDPERDRAPKGSAEYAQAVAAWHDARAEIFGAMITDELGADGVGAFLVWGDPSLYDGTIRIVEELIARGVEFDNEVIPAVSSLHSLTARHRIPLNRIGEPIHITPGRLIAGGLPPGLDNVVVMLDGDCAFTAVDDDRVHIYWGAYLGTPDEILIAGPVTSVAEQIVRVRAQARERKGWIMDTYLLRRL
jgi:precorrin-6A synthase